MRFLLFALVFWSHAALAQTFPDYGSTTVNDLADVLSPAEETTLSQQLETLKQETGVEMTVLTLETQTDYAPDLTLEQFATRLFDHWGIGDASRNDGVLVLVIKEDRAMRLELGKAYGRAWDNRAQRIVDKVFVPAFKDSRYGTGILNGSDAVIRRIVMPHHTGEGAPNPTLEAIRENWPIGVLLGFFGAFAARRKIGDQVARLRTCPNCGRRGMRQNREVLKRARGRTEGKGVRRVRCRHCDYREDHDYVIAVSSDTGDGGFGGGSSGGGGASGRW